MQKVKLELKLDEYKNNSYLTHNYHPYPAKYIPQIPKEIILKYSKPGDIILDPFCGSGTTLVEAVLNNRSAIGIDLNPIAYLISKVKTTILSPLQIRKIIEYTDVICEDIKKESKYPIPEFHNIDHWFKDFVQREFSVIKHHLNAIKNITIKDFITIAFSSLINKLSNQDSDTRYAFKDKTIKKLDSSLFLKRKIDDMIRRNIEFSNLVSKCKATVYKADSCNLNFIKDKISTAITSPPYMNSFDYYLYHKHRMHWLGFDVKDVQEKEFGSRNKHNDQGHGIQSYEDCICENAREVKRLLKKDGKYCIVVGDSILKGELIKMDKIFDKILIKQLGFSKIDEVKFDQRKYTRTFTPNLKSAFKETYVLVYQK